MNNREILFITGNQNKLNEAIEVAKQHSVKLIGQKLDLFEPMESNGTQILIDKTKDAYNKVKKPLLVDDSGIYFEAYPDFPGVFTKFIIKLIGFDGVIRLLKNKDKKAHFKCRVGFLDSNLTDPRVFEGICRGTIKDKIPNEFDNRCEFNSIFIPEGETRVFADMLIEERNKYSHRAKALNNFFNWYKTYEKH